MYAAAARPFSSLSNTLLAAAVVDKEDICANDMMPFAPQKRAANLL